jgi:hypothetical protein
MELLDFPEEILMEIMSKLDQKDRHLKAALVCKRFLHLTRSPQLQKCVKYQVKYGGNFSPNKLQSLLVMLRDNKKIKKLILTSYEDVFKILKVVAPHGSLRHLELLMDVAFPMQENQEEWKKVFSQICTRLTSFRGFPMIREAFEDFEAFAPLVNAKYLTTLKLIRLLPRSETFRQMADNYTCLQNVEFDAGIDDWSETSDVTYFLDKQKETLTSLVIRARLNPIDPIDPLPAIYKCQKLKKLHLCADWVKLNLNGLGCLSNLKCLCLHGITNSNLGHIIETANFQHLKEIEFIYAHLLSDNDVSQISRAYGQQVYIKISLIKIENL